jgi:putative spermidine/putrescine transport system substrate-binding protein
MDRRAFLTTGSLALSQFLLGCNSQEKTVLNVELLKGSIPAQVLGGFRQQLQQSSVGSFDLNFNAVADIKDIFEQLQTWKRRADTAQEPRKRLISLPFTQPSRAEKTPDLVTLGDYWLATAIVQNLIQPLDITQLQQWQALPETPLNWQQLVTRDQQGQLDPKGNVWAAPYRWGSTVIVYRKDILEREGLPFPTDWSDLWRSEFRDRISLLDHSREVIGLVLKRLGHTYNTDPRQIKNLESELKSLHQQVKFYTSTAYLQALLLGHTWIAVGWSSDVLPQLQRTRKLAAVVPRSGTAIWTDLWVRPVGSAATQPQKEQQSLLNQWLDFCWQPETAQRLSSLSDAASPILAGKRSNNQPAVDSILLPDAKILEDSDFLQPLPNDVVNQYRSLWLAIRRSEYSETQIG